MVPTSSVAELSAAFITLVSSGSNEIDPAAWLIYNGGALGVVMLLVITGQLRTKAEVNQLNARIENQDRLIAAFQSQLTGQTIPALARSAQVIENLPTNEASMREEVRATTNRIADLQAQITAMLNRERDDS